MGGGGSKGHNYSGELAAMGDQMKAMNEMLVQSQATLTTMQNRITDKEKNLQVITQNKAQSDCELAGARAELAGLRSSANDKENKLQVITQYKAKSDRELAAAQVELAGLRSSANEKENKLRVMTQNKAHSDCELAAARAELAGLRRCANDKENQLQAMARDKAKSDSELNALHDTIAKDKIRYAQGAMALLRQNDTMMSNIVANSRGGESLNVKRELVIRILSEMREDFEEMIEWCLKVAGGEVSVGEGKTILKYFYKHSGELVKEIRNIKGFVCTMKMENELKQQIAEHLKSMLESAIDLNIKVRESRFDLIGNPGKFTLDHITKCLDMVEKAAWDFPHMKTLEQCIEDEKKVFQQSVDNALKLSIGN